MLQKDTLKFESAESTGLSSDNSYTTFLLTPAHEPVSGKVGNMAGFMSCRDGLGTTMRDLINADELPTDKLRLIMMWHNYTNDTAQDWCGRGIRCLHAFEKLAGWPLTRAIQLDNAPHGYFTVYFRGSRRWLKTSYLVTLYVLLVRMCQDKRIDGFKTFDDMVKKIDNLSELRRDDHHVRATMPYWRSIALGYPYLFEQFKLKYYWDTARIEDQGGYGEGITKLCDGNTYYSEAYTRLKEVKRDIDKNGKLTLSRKKTAKKS